VIPTSTQDVRQAKNRKRGMKFKKNLLSNYWVNLPTDTFLDENHPMTISSKFSSYWANGFRQEDFYGNIP
jgi:hypothetical protein